MAYPKKIKNRAYLLYSQYLSYENIAFKLKAEFPDDCPKLRRQTVEAWSNRLSWEDRRDAIEQRIARRTDDKIVSRRVELLGSLRDIRERLVNQVIDKNLQAKSLEGAVNSLINLAKMELELSGERQTIPNKINIEKMMIVLFDVLSEDPKLGKLLKERQDLLLQAINDKLLGNE